MDKVMKIPEDVLNELVKMKERPRDAAWRSIVKLLKVYKKVGKEYIV